MDLSELLTLPGVKETCVLRSAIGIMALHGGSQDRGTDQIASRVAEQAGASYYAIVQPEWGLYMTLLAAATATWSAGAADRDAAHELRPFERRDHHL